MEDKLKQLFSDLRDLKPAKEFAERSKRLVLASPQLPPINRQAVFRIFEHLKLSGALVLASIFLFIALGGISYFKLTSVSPIVLTNFDSSKLVAEADTLDLEINIREAKYFEDTEKEVQEALKKLAK